MAEELERISREQSRLQNESGQFEPTYSLRQPKTSLIVRLHKKSQASNFATLDRKLEIAEQSLDEHAVAGKLLRRTLKMKRNATEFQDEHARTEGRVNDGKGFAGSGQGYTQLDVQCARPREQ